MIKAVPKNVARRKTFRSADFFRNEINFYEKVLSKCQLFQERVKPKIKFDNVGVCLAAYFDGINDYIIMEDLTIEGFTTGNRQEGMDFNHLRIALESLGKFHGLSLVYRHQKPEEFDKLINEIEVPFLDLNFLLFFNKILFFQEVYYSENQRSWYKEFQIRQEIAARHAVSNEYPGSIYLEKLENFFSGDLFAKMCKMTHTQNKYSVFVHGDCWAPNFLFKYDDHGVPLSAKIIDFQLARFASPALDISFFIYSCTDQTTRELYFEELLKAYHSSLSNLVQAFGSDPEVVFPYSALMQEMKEFGAFGVGMGIESIPMSILDEGCDCNVQGEDEVPIHTVMIVKPIEKKEGRQRLADIFKHAVDQGYL